MNWELLTTRQMVFQGSEIHMILYRHTKLIAKILRFSTDFYRSYLTGSNVVIFSRFCINNKSVTAENAVICKIVREYSMKDKLHW